MTYLGFHLIFVVPVLLLLAWPARTAASRLGPRARWAPWAVPVLALAYTTPWDNYLVWRGVWAYGSERVLGTVGYVPVEEYLFFVLQPLLTGAWLLVVLDRVRAPERHRDPHSHAKGSEDPEALHPGSPVAGVALLVGLALVGVLLLRTEPGTYMGLILAWACPLLAVMWAFTWRTATRLGRPLAVGVGLPTVYLWVADRVAIAEGVWTISDRYTLGVDPLGLPVEEATFFLATNALVGLGLLWFLVPGWERPG